MVDDIAGPGRGGRTRSAHRVPMLVLFVLFVLLTAHVSGCLFPPVTPPDEGDPDGPDDPDLPDDPTPPEDPETGWRTGSWEQVGTIETAATVEGTPAGQEVHDFPLPARIHELTLRFDWAPVADEDLDITLVLRDSGEEVWRHRADEGNTGDPDRPIEVTFLDVPAIHSTNDTLLVATVTAKVTYETSYSVYIHVRYAPDTE